jgi:hypothetical protein
LISQQNPRGIRGIFAAANSAVFPSAEIWTLAQANIVNTKQAKMLCAPNFRREPAVRDSVGLRAQPALCARLLGLILAKLLTH